MTGIIKVDTIQNNGGTTGLTIDSSGRVLTPARPAFNVNGIAGGDATMSGNSSPSSPFFITHNTADLNQGNCWSSSTGKFTAPIGGVYHFYATITYKNKNERWVSGGFFDDSGNAYTTSEYHGMSLMDDVEGTTQYASVQPSMTILLSANNTVRVGAFSDDGDAGLWNPGHHFGGFLVG